MVLLIWILTLLVLAFWSAAGWGLHLLLVAGPGWLEQLPAWVASLPRPALLDQWLPEWQTLLIEGASLAHLLLGWLGGAGVVIVWLVWATGTASLLGLASLLTWAIRQAGSRQPPDTPPSSPPTAPRATA